MKFEDFLKRGLAKRKNTDMNLVNSLKRNADNDLVFLGGLEINDISARKIVTGYYDVLRTLLEIVVELKGYKVYSHEAFTYFLRENGEEDISKKFDRIRMIRNKINYYGKNVSCAEAEDYYLKINEMIKYFIRKVEECA